MVKINKNFKVTLIKSLIGVQEKHRNTVRALGLHKIGNFVVHSNTPQISGMIDKVNYLLKIEEI